MTDTPVDISEANCERVAVWCDEIYQHDYAELVRALRTVLTDATFRASEWEKDFGTLAKERDELRTALTARGEALRKYGIHGVECFITAKYLPDHERVCTCGLDAAMEKANMDSLNEVDATGDMIVSFAIKPSVAGPVFHFDVRKKQ